MDLVASTLLIGMVNERWAAEACFFGLELILCELSF